MNNENSMKNEMYYEALGYDAGSVKDMGGQELILADIMACLYDCRSIYVPFNCPSLEETCAVHGIRIVSSEEGYDAVYWGTPTIVDDRVLFPDCLPDMGDVSKWNALVERATSQRLRMDAELKRAKVIVTGLGTGDISVAQRIEDMGGGVVVSYKNFGDFEDRVIMRKLLP